MRRYARRYNRWGNHPRPLTRSSGLSRRRNSLDPGRLLSFRRRNVDFDRLSSFRRNPDPEGNPWGPSLYDPLADKNNKFKDESHYKNVISKLYKKNPLQGDDGLFDSIYSRRRRNPWGRRRHNSRRNPWNSRRTRRRNPLRARSYRRNPGWSFTGNRPKRHFDHEEISGWSFRGGRPKIHRRDYGADRYRRNPGWSFNSGRPVSHDRELDAMYPTRKKPDKRYRRNSFMEGVKGAARVTGRALTTEGARLAETAGRKLEDWGRTPTAAPRAPRRRRRNPEGLFPKNGLYSSIYARRRRNPEGLFPKSGLYSSIYARRNPYRWNRSY